MNRNQQTQSTIFYGEYSASVVLDTLSGLFEVALLRQHGGKRNIVNIRRMSLESAQAQTRKWSKRYPRFVTMVREGAQSAWLRG